MVEIKLSDLNETERSEFVNSVDGDKAGCGIVYNGKYHIMLYSHLNETDTGKCVGVELITYTTNTAILYEDPSRNYHHGTSVLFNVPWESRIFKNESFKDRLDKAIKDQTDILIKLDKTIDDNIARIAKEKRDREEAIRVHTNNVRACQIKLDSTIKTLVPSAKSMIEYNRERLLAEAEKATVEEIVDKEKRLNEPYISKPVFNPLHTEMERQAAINDAILNRTYADAKPYPKEFVTELIFDKTELLKQNANSNTVITAELVSPDNPHYFTDLEIQQATRRSSINQSDII